MYDEGGRIAVMATRATRNIASPGISTRASSYQYSLCCRIEQAVTGMFQFLTIDRL